MCETVAFVDENLCKIKESWVLWILVTPSAEDKNEQILTEKSKKVLRSDNLVNHRAEAAAAGSSDRRQKSLIKYKQADGFEFVRNSTITLAWRKYLNSSQPNLIQMEEDTHPKWKKMSNINIYDYYIFIFSCYLVFWLVILINCIFLCCVYLKIY